MLQEFHLIKLKIFSSSIGSDLRWDLELANNKIIKLSKKDIKENLDDVLEFFNNEKFKDTKIFDARIKNQIIINE